VVFPNTFHAFLLRVQLPHGHSTSATSGDALFHAKKDDRGHYLLFGKPVFISNSFPDIGSTNKPLCFADFSRLLIRHVPAEAVIRRYDELYMAKAEPKRLTGGGQDIRLWTERDVALSSLVNALKTSTASLMLWPARSRSRLATLYIESSDSFVAFAAASIGKDPPSSPTSINPI